VHQEPVANHRIHTSHIGTRIAGRKERFRSFAEGGERDQMMTELLPATEPREP
jgi:hypothetical protein